ncbi:MAG TPA: four helix bundle protein [Candidatus Acidoferrales bacterium]
MQKPDPEMMSGKQVIKSYRDLVVWQRSMDLVTMCYKLSRRLPDTERYGLVSQMQRSSVSVPANIAEGYGRRQLGDYLQHLSIANGSLKEVETHLVIAVRLSYLTDTEIAPALKLADETGRMLNSLMSRLRQRKP